MQQNKLDRSMRACRGLFKNSLFAFALMTLTAWSWSSTDSDSDRDCRNLVRITDLNHAIEPGMLVPATATVPEHCRVRGVINRAIRFEVTLPTDWNGRMMFNAVGGAAGVIGDTRSLLGQGYAQASTDTGHESSEGVEFYAQPEALLDYAYRGVHLATVASKRIVETYYGRASDYDYLSGCSNGGRAAMLEATRYPNDYDGIIAGAPLFRFQEFLPKMIAIYRAQTAHPLTEEALQVLDDATRQACDANDGVEDGVISDPLNCSFDIESLECAGGETSGCLSAGQIETARTVYADLVSPNGTVLSPGVPPGAEAAGDWAFWMLANDQQMAMTGGGSIISMMGNMLTLLKRHDPTFSLDEFDPIGDYEALAEATNALDVQTADLAEFRKQGGKLLMYQGWNDWPLRPQRAISYLEDVESEMGGRKKTDDFYRLFMVPGMVHCAGGPGAWQVDWVAPLVQWREKGTTPKRIVGTRPASTQAMDHLAPASGTTADSFTRPHCPYPQYAEYRGRGDVADERNYQCAKP